MAQNLRNAGRFALVTLGCGAMAAGLIQASTSASAQTPIPEQQLSALRQQVVTLERRVAELEKLKGGGGVIKPDDTSAQDARTRKLEQRLAALEQEQANKEVAMGPGKATTVTAPFLVMDRAGKLIARVGEETEGLSRGLHIFAGGAKPMAFVGATGSGGRVYVASPNAAVPEVQMYLSDTNGPSILMRGKNTSVDINDKGGLTMMNSGQKVIANISSKDSRGYLELNDAAGTMMLEAGSLPAGKGYVLVTPWRTRAGVTGDPSVLKGGSGK